MPQLFKFHNDQKISKMGKNGGRALHIYSKDLVNEALSKTLYGTEFDPHQVFESDVIFGPPASENYKTCPEAGFIVEPGINYFRIF